MNLPNKLTVGRIIMVPVVITVILLTGIISEYITLPLASLLFLITSLTDMLDGKIARKRGLVTNFGKFLDPLADKILVIGCMLAIQYTIDGLKRYFFWTLLIVVFRELTVTGLRLIAVSSPDGEVIAAAKLGKIKTVMQIICIMSALTEAWFADLVKIGGEGYIYPLSLLTCVLTVVFTVWSGIDYFVKYRKYIKDKK